MLPGLFILLLCQLAGEAIAHAAHLPVPGPVIGIVILLAILTIRHHKTGRDATEAATPLGSTSDALLRNLGLLFVPAGAGIVQSIGLVATNGVAVGLALTGSAIITLIVTVATFRLVSRLVGRTEGTRA